MNGMRRVWCVWCGVVLAVERALAVVVMVVVQVEVVEVIGLRVKPVHPELKKRRTKKGADRYRTPPQVW